MIDTILFDLDGTLLQFTQDRFIDAYFNELRKVFINLELDVELAVKAVWAGTKAMVLNDGTKYNSERFWAGFSDVLGLSGDCLKAVEDACDRFYSNEYGNIKSILENNDPERPRRMVRYLVSRGFTVVLATNPLFPACAVTTRMGWVGLTPQDFYHVTDYTNSTYCKPNPDYYREILKKICKEPQQCLMIGNNTKEDMCVNILGMETFLVTDYIENENNMDISAFRHGTLADLEEYLKA